MTKHGRDAEDALTTGTTVADLLVELRTQLHVAALLGHCTQSLRAHFLSEESPPRSEVCVQGFGPEPVIDEALLCVESLLAEAELRAQARADGLLRRVVLERKRDEAVGAPGLRARVVARREARGGMRNEGTSAT
jgi:hypothetical protein